MVKASLMKDFVAHYVIYTDDWFLEDSIDMAIKFVDKIVIARTLRPWNGDKRDLSETEAILDKLLFKYGERIEIYEAEFESEQQQRNFLLEKSKAEGYRGAFIIDTDEIFLPEAFQLFYKYILTENPAAIRSSYFTFIKDASFTVAPPYETNLFYVSLESDVFFEWARRINREPLILFNDEPAILHFSYLRKSDEDILKKIQNFMHHNDADWKKWYDEVYLKFNRNLKNFHPVQPEVWPRLEYFDVSKFPQDLKQKLLTNGKLFYYERVLNNPQVKLHLGCGEKILDGYINIDLYNPKAELNLDIEDLSYFEDNSVSEIFMNAVFEHIYTFQQMPCLLEWKRVLKPNGLLRIDSIPDFDIYAKAYFDKARGNVSEVFDLYEVSRYTHGEYKKENKFGQIHKDIFNKAKVRQLITDAGFEIEKLENVHWEDEPVPCNINVRARKPEHADNPLLQAERYLNEGEFEQSEQILRDLLKRDPDNAQALNDLAVIRLQENKTDEGKKLLQSAFLLDVQDEAILNNLYYLYSKGYLTLTKEQIKTRKDYNGYYRQHQADLKRLNDLRRQLIQENKEGIQGICRVCNAQVNFKINLPSNKTDSTLSVICPHCQLNEAQRAALHYVLDNGTLKEDTRFFLTETDTPFFNLIKQNFSVLNDDARSVLKNPAGSNQLEGVKNKNDFVIDFETLNHADDYRGLLNNFFQLLREDGTLLLTPAFDPNLSRRIAVNETDKNDDSTSVKLNFRFGWHLLNDLHDIGFKTAFVLFVWSPVFGYYTPNSLIVARK